MKIVFNCRIAKGNPFSDLANCKPELICNTFLFLNENEIFPQKIAQALKKLEDATQGVFINRETKNVVSIQSSKANALFLSDLLHNVLPGEENLSSLSTVVRFDPTNKRGMTLNQVCNSVKTFSQEEIHNHYLDIAAAMVQNHEAEEQSQAPCFVM